MLNAISMGSRQAGSAHHPWVMMVSPSQARRMTSVTASRSAAGSSSHATASPVELTATRWASRTAAVTG